VQLVGKRRDLGRQAGDVGMGQAGELGIGLAGEPLGLRQLIFGSGEALGQSYDRRQPGMLPAQGLQLGGILGRGGIGEEPFHLLRPLHGLAESGLHGLRLGPRRGGLGLVLPAEAIHPACRIHQALLAGEIRVALGAHLDVNRARGGPGLERIAAGAHGRELAVLGVKIGLHERLRVPGKPRKIKGIARSW